MSLNTPTWNRPLGPFAILYQAKAAPPVLTKDELARLRKNALKRRAYYKAKALQVNKDTSSHLSTQMTNSYKAPR